MAVAGQAAPVEAAPKEVKEVRIVCFYVYIFFLMFTLWDDSHLVNWRSLGNPQAAYFKKLSAIYCKTL